MPLDIPPPAPQTDTTAADVRAAERRVLLGYVPPGERAGVEALLSLDAALAGIVRTTREPIVGQMRLTWWYEALGSIDDGAPPVGEPILAALASEALPRGVAGRALAAMTDAWELLLAPDPIDPTGVREFARGRGGALFTALAAVLGGHAGPAAIRAGEGWALADLAAHLSDPAQAALARTMASESFDGVFRTPWPRAIRPLGMLALLARADLAAGSPRPGSPRRLARLLMHRIWGR